MSGFYTHPAFKDVYCFVKVQYKDAKRVKVKLSWWNWGYVGKPFDTKITTKHTLTPDKFREFIPIAPHFKNRKVIDGNIRWT